MFSLCLCADVNSSQFIPCEKQRSSSFQSQQVPKGKYSPERLLGQY